MDAIRTEGLTKHYSVGFWRSRPYVALDGLTLEVARGEVFGFLGPNGAGKTTTLKLLMQLIFPTAGRAWILDRPAGDVDDAPAHRLPAGEPHLLRQRHRPKSCWPTSRRCSATAAPNARGAWRALLDEVGLGAERRMQLRKYSKGMIQRVGLAQALINDPEVVFLDEPMSGLDPIGRREVRDIILRLRDRGATVFFSSHILADAEAMCSRVGIVAGGKLVAAGALAEMVPFRIRGWDLVLAGMSGDGGRVARRRAARRRRPDRRRPVSRRAAVDGVV